MDNEYTLDELDIDYENLGPDRFDAWVQIGRENPDGVLRTFTATVEFGDPDSMQIFQVGTLTGWYTTKGDYAGLADEGDSISGDAHVLAGTSAQINAEFAGVFRQVLLIDRVTLVEEWRGHKIMGALSENIVDLLQFEADSTMAVMVPEPLSLDTGEALDDGRERDAGMAKLHAACRVAGYEPWYDSDVWWRPFGLSADMIS